MKDPFEDTRKRISKLLKKNVTAQSNSGSNYYRIPLPALSSHVICTYHLIVAEPHTKMKVFLQLGVSLKIFWDERHHKN